MAEHVGFIGLGIMGRGMAANLLRAGFPLTVWNRTPERAEPLAAAGAAVAASPAELGRSQRHRHHLRQRHARRGSGHPGPAGRDPRRSARQPGDRHEHHQPAGNTGHRRGLGRAGRGHAGRAHQRRQRGRGPGHAEHHGRRRGGRACSGPCRSCRPWASASPTWAPRRRPDGQAGQPGDGRRQLPGHGRGAAAGPGRRRRPGTKRWRRSAAARPAVGCSATAARRSWPATGGPASPSPCSRRTCAWCWRRPTSRACPCPARR